MGVQGEGGGKMGKRGGEEGGGKMGKKRRGESKNTL